MYKRQTNREANIYIKVVNRNAREKVMLPSQCRSLNFLANMYPKKGTPIVRTIKSNCRKGILNPNGKSMNLKAHKRPMPVP